MINHEKLKKIEEAYLKYLPDYWSGENFKWKAIQHFQKHWDIEAVDFAVMLDQALAKTYNLLTSGYYYAKAIGSVQADRDLTGALAAEVVSEAIIRAVNASESAYGLPSAAELDLP